LPDFQNYFTAILVRKFAIQQRLNISPHHKCVTAGIQVGCSQTIVIKIPLHLMIKQLNQDGVAYRTIGLMDKRTRVRDRYHL